MQLYLFERKSRNKVEKMKRGAVKVQKDLQMSWTWTGPLHMGWMGKPSEMLSARLD
jgi:hypothetical protein